MSLTTDQALVLALCKIKGVNWHLIAREVQRPDGLNRLAVGDITEVSSEARDAVTAIKEAQDRIPELLDEARLEFAKAKSAGASLVTMVDAGYPATLRLIFNAPPFLFVKGHLQASDVLSVAVVGTRNASGAGISQAESMARLLAQQGVTVVSGLAKGIDTAAHRAALDAGGRTIAVIGTGIRRCYPAENKELAESIVQSGAVVSQFWPDGPPTTYSFPRRNVTMSGIAQGTVVIEASSTSGAKMQARLALEHGKKVFLLRSLTQQQEWAQKYAKKPDAYVVDDVADVLRLLVSPEKIKAADERREQLSLFPV